MIPTNYTYKDQLESDRIITRFLTEKDYKAWSEFFEDDEATELFPDSDFQTNDEIAKHWIDKQMLRYKNKAYGLQALIDKQTNEFIGLCGLITQTVDDKPEVEVGYHILKKHWGKGLATEVSKLFLDFAFQNKQTNSVVSIIDKRNIRSEKVVIKNGLKREKETIWSGIEVYIYRIFEKDWNKR